MPKQHNDPTMHQVTIELTSAQIKALNASPVEVLEAPGEGNIIYVDQAVMFFHPGEVAYDISAGGNLTLLYDTGSIFEGLGNSATGLTSLTQQVLMFDTVTAYTGGPSVARSAAENKPLKLKKSGSGEFTEGDGTATLVVNYSIMRIT